MLQLTPTQHVPNSYRVITAGSRDETAITTKRDRRSDGYCGLAAAREIAQLAIGCSFPELDRVAAIRTGGEQFAVRTEDHARRAEEIVVSGLKDELGLRFTRARVGCGAGGLFGALDSESTLIR